MRKLFRLIQFSDSAFPVGSFSFSNGLETAAHIGIVHNSSTLESYVRAVARQAAFTDGVAAIHAWRAACAKDYAGILDADRQLMLVRLNDEGRQMLARMGKKLAELGLILYGDDSLFSRWLRDIESGKTPGTYPVAQAIAFAQEGMDEKELFVAHQYGTINMILSASLRCARVSHYDTQKILFNLGEQINEAYKEAKGMNLENMNAFVPEMDIFASMHEKGSMRMFMN